MVRFTIAGSSQLAMSVGPLPDPSGFARGRRAESTMEFSVLVGRQPRSGMLPEGTGFRTCVARKPPETLDAWELGSVTSIVHRLQRRRAQLDNSFSADGNSLKVATLAVALDKS